LHPRKKTSSSSSSSSSQTMKREAPPKWRPNERVKRSKHFNASPEKVASAVKGAKLSSKFMSSDAGEDKWSFSGPDQNAEPFLDAFELEVSSEEKKKALAPSAAATTSEKTINIFAQFKTLEPTEKETVSESSPDKTSSAGSDSVVTASQGWDSPNSYQDFIWRERGGREREG
jgi:hypothetical protein